jgi:hypothetical protein
LESLPRWQRRKRKREPSGEDAEDCEKEIESEANGGWLKEAQLNGADFAAAVDPVASVDPVVPDRLDPNC